MSGSTRGPWTVERRGEGFCWPIAEGIPLDRFPLAISIPSPPFAFGELGALVCGPLAEANARLIAAAPDLLEACKRIAADGFGTALGDLEFLRAAIEKAEGR